VFSINKHLAVITDTDQMFNADKPTANNFGQVNIATIASDVNL